MLALFLSLFISYSDVQTVLNSPTFKVPKLGWRANFIHLHILKFNNISLQGGSQFHVAPACSQLVDEYQVDNLDTWSFKHCSLSQPELSVTWISKVNYSSLHSGQILWWSKESYRVKQRHYFANKSPSSQSYGFSSGHVWMWELDCEETWVLKNWCFWTVVLEKTLESPLDCREIQPVSSKGDQSWVFIGRTDAEAETPILWPPHTKSWLIGKDPAAGRDWGQEEKGTTEDEKAGWLHRLDGHEFEYTLGVGDGQGGLACCDSWGRKESDTTERLNWTEPKESYWSASTFGHYFIFTIVRRLTVTYHMRLYNSSSFFSLKLAQQHSLDT